MFASLRFAFHGLLTFSLQAAVRNMVSQQTLISGIWTLLMSTRLSFSVGLSMRPFTFESKSSRAYAGAVPSVLGISENHCYSFFLTPAAVVGALGGTGGLQFNL